MEKASDIKIIIKSLINGIVTWLVVALVLSRMNGLAFAEALVIPYTITAAITACLGSYIGFIGKANAVSINMWHAPYMLKTEPSSGDSVFP